MVAPIKQSVVCPVLVGRAPPVAALERLLERTCVGQGTTALLAGEAGIGKSRLVAEMKERARQRGMLVLEGHCFEADRILPYAPLLDLMRALPGDLSGDELASAFGPVLGDLDALVPELATLVPQAKAAAARPVKDADPEREKRRTFGVLAESFLRLAMARPLLIVIEDLHWSDDTSLAFLLILARRIVERPILLLLTCRDEERQTGLASFLASMDREHLALEYHLARLPLADIETMLRAIFPEWQAVPADLLYTLHTLTEGNPFFIEEALKALLAAGDLAPDDSTWARRPQGEWRVPRSVQDAVQRRLEHLSPGASEVLLLAAITGQRFDFALLQTTTGLDEDALVRRIKELVAAQLVVETTADQFTFRHALTRQAITAQLLGRERRRLHRIVAEALEARYADNRDGHAAELAYHAYEATDWGRAFEYARRAGERAQAFHASHEAIEQFTRALEAARQLALPVPLVIVRARGRAYETLGDFAHAQADYMAALTAAQVTGDDRAAWQALLDLGAYWAAHDYAQAGSYLRQALDRARALGSPDSLAQTLNRLGNCLANTGYPDDGLQLHREALGLFEAIEQFTRALEAARQLALPVPLMIVRARGRAYETLGDFAHAQADYMAALTAAQVTGDDRAAWQALLDLGAYWAAHDYAQAGNYLRQALDRARALGSPDSLAQTLNRLGNCLANTGYPDDGLQLHREALGLFEAIGDRPGIAATLDLLGMASVFSGDFVGAVGHLDRAVTLYRALGDRGGLAACLASRGPFAASPGLADTSSAALWSADECLRDANEAAGIMRSLGWPAGVAFVGVGTSPTAIAFGDYGAALAWTSETLRIATEIGHQQWRVAAHGAIGLLYTDLFRPERAIEHLETALTLARELGSAWWISQNTVALVRACFLAGDLARAEAALAAVYPSEAIPPKRPAGVAERRIAWLWGELALRRGDSATALRIADDLLATVPVRAKPQPIPALLKLRGEALASLGRLEAAEEALLGTKRGATERGQRPLLWQTHRALGHLYERRKRPQQAAREFAAAREIIAALADTVPDEAMREHYRAAALATLPQERPPTTLRAAQEAYGGLTRREREVAALIAQGKSNREIAAALFMGEGTVATHVSSILGKLGFASRAQIAAWAVERGLGTAE